jgi:Ca2+-binding RTX toxin-like protein
LPDRIEVVGTDGDDSILFQRVNASTVRIIVNGTPQSIKAPGRLVAYGGDGNDSITTKSIDRPVVFYGEAGNDTLMGGSGDDRMYGGDGNDILRGNTGNDLLAGNAGNDKLYGENGHDVLLCGTGADLLRGDNGNDLGNPEFTSVRYWPPGTPAPLDNIANELSLAFGDANDEALRLFLNDWADDYKLQTWFFMPSVSDGFADDWDSTTYINILT